MEIYSPNSRSKELFQKNRMKSEVIKEKISENQAEPKPAINIQYVVRKRSFDLSEKVRAIKERLMEFLELNETTV
jgi:hypothetical protein